MGSVPGKVRKRFVSAAGALVGVSAFVFAPLTLQLFLFSRILHLEDQDDNTATDFDLFISIIHYLTNLIEFLVLQSYCFKRIFHHYLLFIKIAYFAYFWLLLAIISPLLFSRFVFLFFNYFCTLLIFYYYFLVRCYFLFSSTEPILPIVSRIYCKYCIVYCFPIIS
jgi:hypothetical protein